MIRWYKCLNCFHIWSVIYPVQGPSRVCRFCGSKKVVWLKYR